MSLTLPGEREPLSAGALEEACAPPSAQWTRANLVVTLDGAIEADGRSGGLGDEDDRRVFSALRAVADVILVGSSTAKAEDYGPAQQRPEVQERRRARGQGDHPPIAVVSSSASLDPGARLFTGDGPRPIVVTTERAGPDRRAALEEVAEVVVCGDDEVDLVATVTALRERALGRILCEGGPTILGALLALGLLDELCLSHAPLLAGPGHGLLVGGKPLEVPIAVRRRSLLLGDDLLFGRYQVRGP